MDFSFSEEQQSIGDLAKQILTDKATHERLREIERGGGPRFDADLWSEMAKAGLLGIAIPEAFGGAGLGFLEVALIVEQMGYTAAPIPLIETIVMAALPLAEFGTEEQKERLLGRVTTGEVILTAALVEAEGEPRRPAMKATAQGEGWRLDGTKLCVPAGQLAECILVPAATGGGAVGVFLVDPKGAGARLEELDTTSGQPQALLELDGYRVGAKDVLGSPQSGGEIVDWIDLRTNAALSVLAAGVCAKALELTAEYTKTRKQFDQPIAMFQAVGQRAADAYIDTEGVQLTAWQAAWRIAVGRPAHAEVAVAKHWASEAGQRVVHAAQHLHGGIGVDRDYPLHRQFLYAKQLELTLGGSSTHLRRLGRILAERPA